MWPLILLKFKAVFIIGFQKCGETIGKRRDGWEWHGLSVVSAEK